MLFKVFMEYFESIFNATFKNWYIWVSFFFSRFCFLVAYNIYVENIQDTIETVTVSPSPAIRAVILKNWHLSCSWGQAQVSSMNTCKDHLNLAILLATLYENREMSLFWRKCILVVRIVLQCSNLTADDLIAKTLTWISWYVYVKREHPFPAEGRKCRIVILIKLCCSSITEDS